MTEGWAIVHETDHRGTPWRDFASSASMDRGYRADYPDSPIRPTRAEAEQDWCNHTRTKEDL